MVIQLINTKQSHSELNGIWLPSNKIAMKIECLMHYMLDDPGNRQREEKMGKQKDFIQSE
jgi:hypothetical protein